MPKSIGINSQRIAKYLELFLTASFLLFGQDALSLLKEFRQSVCQTLVDLMCPILCPNQLESIPKE